MAKGRTRKVAKPKATRQKAGTAAPAGPPPLESNPESDGGVMRCPVCRKPFYEQCEHLTFTQDDTEDNGFWDSGGDEEGFREVVERINKAVRVAFTDEQLEFVCALLRLPGQILGPLAEGLGEDFVQYEWRNVLIAHLRTSPTFAGSTDGESDTAPSVSSWTCYWDREPEKVRAWDHMDKYLRALRKVAKKADQLPKLNEEQE